LSVSAAPLPLLPIVITSITVERYIVFITAIPHCISTTTNEITIVIEM
jgi:hypothetical protein